MHLYLSVDEKYPHTFAVPEGHRDAVESERRVVPDVLAMELLALDSRREELLQKISQHLEETGQERLS